MRLIELPPQKLIGKSIIIKEIVENRPAKTLLGKIKAAYLSVTGDLKINCDLRVVVETDIDVKLTQSLVKIDSSCTIKPEFFEIIKILDDNISREELEDEGFELYYKEYINLTN